MLQYRKIMFRNNLNLFLMRRTHKNHQSQTNTTYGVWSSKYRLLNKNYNYPVKLKLDNDSD